MVETAVRDDDTAETGDRERVLRFAAIAAPVGLSLVFGFWDVSHKSMFGSEAVTYWAGHLPFQTLLHVLRHVDAVHGLYYALMHVVFQFGGGTFVLRLPSVIGMSAAVLGTALLARRLSGSDRAAFLAGTAMAISPLATQYAQMGRSYAIDTAAAVGTWWLLVRAVDDATAKRWRPWALYSVAMIVTAYLHEMTLFLLAAHAITLIWSRTPRPVLMRWARTVPWIVIGSGPLLYVSYRQDRQVKWIKPPTLTTVRTMYETFLGPNNLAITINLVLIAVAVISALGPRRAEPGLTVTRLALPVFVAAPGLLLLESKVAIPLYGGLRYVIWALPAMAMLVGYGLDRAVSAALAWAPRVSASLRARVPALGLAIAALVLALSLQWSSITAEHTATGSPQDLHAVADYIQHAAQPGDGVIYAPRTFEAAKLGYPHQMSVLADLVLARSSRRSGELYGTEKTAVQIRAAVGAARRIWLIGTQSPTGSTNPALIELRQHFRRASIRHFFGANVALYIADQPVAARD